MDEAMKSESQYINYLAHMLDEAMDDKTIEGEVSKEDIQKFVDNIGKEVSESLAESEEEDVNKMKAEIFDFISKMKTREDLEEFIRVNKAAMQGFQRKKTVPEKIKKYVSKIWDIICYVVKAGLFCIRNITSIGILAAVVFVCVKFEVSPIDAITKGYEAAKIIYKAADASLNGAKVAVDAYGKVQDGSESVGEKVGNIIGKGIYYTELGTSKLKNVFK